MRILFDLLIGFIILGIYEGFVKDLAVGFVDQLLYPNLDEVFELTNLRMPDWMAEKKTGKEMSDAILAAFIEKNPQIEGNARAESRALKTYRRRYDPVKNIEKLNEHTQPAVAVAEQN